MIGENSILKRLPINMDRKQVFFLDGIRHAAEMAEFSHQHLLRVLLGISTGDGRPGSDEMTSAFLFAWSIVDAVDRFRALWKLQPNAGTLPAAFNGPCVERQLGVLRKARNVADHLAERADYVIARNGTALGTLSWVFRRSPEEGPTKAFVLLPGSFREASLTLPQPQGEISLPVGFVQLKAGEHVVNLSDSYKVLSGVIEFVELTLPRMFSQMGSSSDVWGIDIVASADLVD